MHERSEFGQEVLWQLSGRWGNICPWMSSDASRAGEGLKLSAWLLLSIDRKASICCLCFHLHSRTCSRSQPSRNQTCYLLQHACSFNANFITSYCTGALLMQISLPVTVQWRFNADFMNLLQHRCSFNADFINLLLYRCSLIQSSLIFCSTGALLMQISLTCYSTGALLMQISLTSYGTGALFMQISYTFCVNLEQVG